MTTLPPTLAAWRAQLELFAPELVAPLAHLVQRIAPAIGPFQTSESAHDGEIDGFAGLTRRGSFERLLVSEWALAEAIPDEFIRRAASNELSFLELARHRPAAARTSAVLFDTGPDLLGGPRIVQLAILIVLAHRAETAGASFGWQTLENTPGVLHAGLTRDGVNAFLASRSALPAGDAEVRAWMERLSRGPRLDELWIVGSPRTCTDAISRTLSRVRIRDLLEPGPMRVSVSIAPARRLEREITLELPRESECIRLLRDPLRSAKSRRRVVSPVAPQSNLVFTSNERWLYARNNAVRGVIRYPVPNSARAIVGRPRQYEMQLGMFIAAAGQMRSGALLLGFGGRNIEIESKSEKRGQRLRIQGQLPEGVLDDVEAPSPRLRPLIHEATRHGPALWWSQQRDGSLLRVYGSPGARISHIARDTKAIIPIAGGTAGLVYVARALDASDDSPWWIRNSDGSPYGAQWGWPLAVENVDRCFGVSAYGGDLTLAICDGDGRWTVLQGAVTRRYTPDGEVVGVSPSADDPGLVVLDADARALWAIGRSRSVCLAKSEDRIVDAVVGPLAQVVAYVTERGRIVVVQTGSLDVVARFETRGGAA